MGERWDQSEGDEVTTQPFAPWEGTGSPADELRNREGSWGYKYNQRQHRHSDIFRPQRLRELKTGGREVCNSELRVEYGPEIVRNQREYTDGDIRWPARLQRLRELKACGREVCTSELQVEYAPEMVYPDTRSQREHTDGDINIRWPPRLQRLCKLKAGGREVCTSELQVECTQMIGRNLKIW